MGKVRKNRGSKSQHQPMPRVGKRIGGSFGVNETAAVLGDGADALSKKSERSSAASTAVVGKSSRGQRKRQQRRERFTEKLLFLDREKKRREENKVGKALFDIDALTQELLKTNSSAGAGNATAQTASTSFKTKKKKGKKMNNRKRRQLELEEVARMRQVMQHPAFIADPLATIATHLTNTAAASQRS